MIWMADENCQSYNVTLLLLLTAMDLRSRQPTAPSTIPNLVARLNRTTRLRKFSHHGRLSHQKWCAQGYGFRGMFYLILTTFSWLLLAGAGANSGCDRPIDDRELLGLCFPFWYSQVCLRHQRRQAFVKLTCACNSATNTTGTNILKENNEWVCLVNYSDPDSECK